MIGLPKRPVEIIVATVIAAIVAMFVIYTNVVSPLSTEFFGANRGDFLTALVIMTLVVQCVAFGTSLISEPLVRISVVNGCAGALFSLFDQQFTAVLAFAVLAAAPVAIAHACALMGVESVPMAIARRRK